VFIPYLAGENPRKFAILVFIEFSSKLLVLFLFSVSSWRGIMNLCLCPEMYFEFYVTLPAVPSCLVLISEVSQSGAEVAFTV